MDEKMVRKAIDLGKQNDSTYILGESVVTTLLRQAYGELKEQVKDDFKENRVNQVDTVALERESVELEYRHTRTPFDESLPELLDVEIESVFGKRVKSFSQASIDKKMQFKKLGANVDVPLEGIIYKGSEPLMIEITANEDLYRVDFYIGAELREISRPRISLNEPWLYVPRMKTEWTILLIGRQLPKHGGSETIYHLPIERMYSTILVDKEQCRDENGKVRFTGSFDVRGIQYNWHKISVKEAKG